MKKIANLTRPQLFVAGFGILFTINLLIGLLFPSPRPKAAAVSKTLPSPAASPVATPSPTPTISPAMLALGEKAVSKTKADLTTWGSPIAGTEEIMLLVPTTAWDELSKTEKAALTYYAEDKAIRRGLTDKWRVVNSYSDKQPYSVDTTLVVGDRIDRSDLSFPAQSAKTFRAEMLTP
jgi:hypothetical protein